MNFATVIGTIWATRRHPSTNGMTFQIIRPEDAAGNPLDRPLIAVDSVGAGPGERVFYVTAREATIPLPPPETPIDATIVGIVEGIEEREGA